MMKGTIWLILVIMAILIFAMIGGRVLMKEKLTAAQYACLLGIVAGSVMAIAGTVS